MVRVWAKRRSRNPAFSSSSIFSAVVRQAAEKVELLEKAGFRDLHFSQTLTTHPLYSDRAEEQPVEGCDRGDYVAVVAYKR